MAIWPQHRIIIQPLRPHCTLHDTYHFITSTLDPVEGLTQGPGQVHFFCHLQPCTCMCLMRIFYQDTVEAADDSKPASAEPFLPLQRVVKAAWQQEQQSRQKVSASSAAHDARLHHLPITHQSNFYCVLTAAWARKGPHKPDESAHA